MGYIEPNCHPSLLKRRVIHLDMDAFYASVEVRDHPQWRGKPIIVGGRPNGRGVVATCSYEARKYGIHSAMPTAHAYRLCPHAIFIKPRFQAYKEASQNVRSIMERYTNLIEPMSLDEAYLDVTDNVACGMTASKIALEIRATIHKELGLTCSAGIAPNKMVAKIASDFRKPNGQTTVPPQQILEFMKPLPVSRIPGVGPVTAEKLAKRGIEVCNDVLNRADEFSSHEGRFERWLWKRCQGIDERPVQTSWERKSIGHEETFGQDIFTKQEVIRQLEGVAVQLRKRMQKAHLVGKTITLKIKYHNFELITRSRTLTEYVHDFGTIISVCEKLMNKTEVGTRPIRLLGISLSNLRNTQNHAFQRPLFL